jgi:hypothetical protein
MLDYGMLRRWKNAILGMGRNRKSHWQIPLELRQDVAMLL